MRPLRLITSRIPAHLQVPLIVVALTILVAVVISQVVLQRLAKEQSAGSREPELGIHGWIDDCSDARASHSRCPGRPSTPWIAPASNTRRFMPYSMLSCCPTAKCWRLRIRTHFPIGSALPADLMERVGDSAGLVIDEDQGRAWLARGVVQEGFKIGTVLSEMDISSLLGSATRGADHASPGE